MATLLEIIKQAISDFDGIETALEECGINVPYDTDTSEYGKLVRRLHTKDTTDTIVYFEAQLATKVDKEDGARLIKEEEVSLLNELKKSAFNLIDIVKVADVALPIVDKSVNIPIAGNDVLGVVKSASGENKVSVAKDGTMYVSVINLNTLVQTEGDELVLWGGSSKIKNT